MLKLIQEYIPSSIAGTAIIVRLTSWLANIDLDSIFITLSAIAGFFYLVMKMYDQYITTKTNKKLYKDLFKKKK